LESEHRRLFSKEIPSGKLEIDENKIWQPIISTRRDISR
jgi:hypothetical protein